MTKKLYCSLAVVASLSLIAPLAAQDWLGVHLDTQREENMRRHQQEQRIGESHSLNARQRYAPSISGKQRHAAMRRHHREYDQIRKDRGYRAADQWLAEQVAAGR